MDTLDNACKAGMRSINRTACSEVAVYQSGFVEPGGLSAGLNNPIPVMLAVVRQGVALGTENNRGWQGAEVSVLQG